jgi:hypothetical protein
MGNQAFSKIWVLIILIVLFSGGIFAWQYLEKPEEKAPAERVKEKELEREPEGKVEALNIIVTSPTPNQIITNPVRVSGKSNTFEGNVRIRIKDDNNKILADTFTGGGTLGTLAPFTKDVFYIKPSAPKGVIEVFEVSPKTGEEINKVSIPITFGPYEGRIVYIKVISPNGGERLVAGQGYKIEWEAVGAERITAFLILPPEEAKRKNCLESSRLISHLPAAWGAGNITIASNTCPSDLYKIKVCDAELWRVGVEACDESDNYFRIVI